jgi:hypothetical protein
MGFLKNICCFFLRRRGNIGTMENTITVDDDKHCWVLSWPFSDATQEISRTELSKQLRKADATQEISRTELSKKLREAEATQVLARNELNDLIRETI